MSLTHSIYFDYYYSFSFVAKRLLYGKERKERRKRQERKEGQERKKGQEAKERQEEARGEEGASKSYCYFFI